MELLQPSCFETESVQKGKIVISKKEMVEPLEEKHVMAETMHQSTTIEELEAESTVDEETYYEVYSPKITEHCEREIPIFVEDRNYMIPSQVSKDAEEAQVRNLIQCSITI